MGLRDRLKGKIKSLFGDAHASDPKPPPPKAAPVAPKAAEPVVTPKAEPPKAAAPVAAKAAEPKVEAQKVEAQKVEAHKAEAPKAEAPKAAASKGAAKGKAKAKAEASAEASTEIEWTDVGPSAAVVEGKAGSWGYKEWVVAVFRNKGTLYAVDNACRHEDGPVGEGEIRACKVQCPYHDWEYDFTTGECTSNPGNRLTTFHVSEADGRIRIGGVLREGTDERGGDHNDGLKVITR